MAGKDRADEGRQAGVPARISETTHRELRYVAAVWSLGAKDGAPTTIRSLIDLAWETLKQQRPDVVELLKRAEPPTTSSSNPIDSDASRR